MAGDARLLSAVTVHRVYDKILPFHLPAGLAEHGNRTLAAAADHDALAIRHGLSGFGATVATVADAHHAWNAEHPRLFSDMVESWATEGTVAPGLLAPAGQEPVDQVLRAKRLLTSWLATSRGSFIGKPSDQR